MLQPNNQTWTDARVIELKALSADHLSASQIATELGHGITRNAVIGKLHRMGLVPSGSMGRLARVKAERKARVRKPRTNNHRAVRILAQAQFEPEPYEPSPIDNVIPAAQRRTLLELTEDTCHWPVGDPGELDFFFCGGQTVNGPYCRYHHHVAHKPAPDRRRDARPIREWVR